MLTLSEIEDWHDGGLFVLWGITFEDFFDELLILRCEFEWYRGIIFGCIAMLQGSVSVIADRIIRAPFERHTTLRESLDNLLLATNERHCDLEAILAGLNADRNTKGVILEAIVAVRWRNGELLIEDIFVYDVD